MRNLLVLLLAAAMLAACTRGGDTPASNDCPDELDDAFAAWADAGFSGSVAITTAGEAECVAAYGLSDREAGTPNTPETVFSIGSVSKAVTAAAILMLVDDDQLGLDDRAGDLLPGLTGPAADATVEQLVVHTSGLTGSHGADHEPLSREEAIAAISRLELAFEPGSTYLYSNAGYSLLALLVEEVSGQEYRDKLMTSVLSLPGNELAGGFWDGEPAASGPRAVGYLDGGPTTEMGDFDGPHWALAGNGDLAMTMRQLAAWTFHLFAGDILSSEARAALMRPRLDQGEGRSEAAGWVVFDETVFGETALATAGGGGDIGHNVVVAWLPESERVIAIASNTADVRAEDLLRAVGPAIVAGDRLPAPAGSDGAGSDPVAQAAATGIYILDTGGQFEVAVSGDGLDVEATGADAVAALFPPSSGFDASDVATHEQAVLGLLAGETKGGRDELEALEEDLGQITDVELAGSVTEDGELRTYVTLITAGGTTLAWYALDEAGGIAAVQLTDRPPTLRLVASGEGRYRPKYAAGSGPDVTISFDTGVATITGPDGTTVARRSGG